MSWLNSTDDELKSNHQHILEAIGEIMDEKPKISTIHEITRELNKKGIRIMPDLVKECLIEKMMVGKDFKSPTSATNSIESPYGGGKDLVEEMKKCHMSLRFIEKESNKRFVFSDESCDISLRDERVCIKRQYKGDFVSDIYLPLDIFKAICSWYYKKLNL